MQFIHDPLLTWRLTNNQDQPGPFQSERETSIVGPQGTRGRRPSVLEGRPQDLLAAQANIEGTVPPTGRARARTNSSAAAVGVNGTNGVNGAPANGPVVEVQNARALEVLDRVQQKLTGTDFRNAGEMDVVTQVNRLIIEATRLENLCQHYIGWCSFW